MRKFRLLLIPIVFNLYKFIYRVFNLLPLRDKVVATAMRGRKYSDDPRFVIEELHRQRPDLDIVWFVDDRWPNNLPTWVRRVPYYKFGMLRRIYEMATSKVWINSHLFEQFVTKKEGQLFVKVDHGSMPLKKVCLDTNINKNSITYKELINNAKIADVFIANSDFHESLYRRGYAFKGPIYKCGFPRNDQLVSPSINYRKIIRDEFNLQGKKILLYVPTFRDDFEKTHVIDYNVYNVDFMQMHRALVRKFGGDWVILQKYHPIMQIYVESNKNKYPFLFDVSSYANTQDLIAASDIVLSDYSSTIIDAAIAGLPVFTICLDYEQYKKDRDMYFDMDKLPFPFAQTNKQLMDNIEQFDETIYFNKWNVFKKSLGMNESGHASKDIADKICSFIDGKKIQW